MRSLFCSILVQPRTRCSYFLWSQKYVDRSENRKTSAYSDTLDVTVVGPCKPVISNLKRTWIKSQVRSKGLEVPRKGAHSVQRAAASAAVSREYNISTHIIM